MFSSRASILGKYICPGVLGAMFPRPSLHRNLWNKGHINVSIMVGLQGKCNFSGAGSEMYLHGPRSTAWAWAG